MAKNIEALDGQMIANIFSSSDNHQLRLIVDTYQNIPHDDAAISFGMPQDLLRGVASQIVKVAT